MRAPNLPPHWFLLAAALASPLLAASARAQFDGLTGAGGAGRMSHFGLGGGFSVPVNHVKDTLENGYALQGFVALMLPGSPFGLRASANYQKFDGKGAFTTSAGAGVGTIASGLGNVSVYLLRSGPVRPYVSAGLGAYSVGSTTTVNGADSTDSSIHFGVNGAAGAEFHFSRSVAAYLEARLENIYTETGFSSEARDLKSIRVLPVVVGITF